MTPERFVELAAAYGGAIARWPETDRAAGADLLAREPALAAPLAREDLLNAMLDGWRVAPPPPALAAAIETAATPRRAARGRLRAWWTGLGLAAALSGAAAGTLAVAAVPAPPAHEEMTAFGDPGGDMG